MQVRSDKHETHVVTYLKRSLPAFAAAANTQREPIELPNSTEPSPASSFAKSDKEEKLTQYMVKKMKKIGFYQ